MEKKHDLQITVRSVFKYDHFNILLNNYTEIYLLSVHQCIIMMI